MQIALKILEKIGQGARVIIPEDESEFPPTNVFSPLALTGMEGIEIIRTRINPWTYNMGNGETVTLPFIEQQATLNGTAIELFYHHYASAEQARQATENFKTNKSFIEGVTRQQIGESSWYVENRDYFFYGGKLTVLEGSNVFSITFDPNPEWELRDLIEEIATKLVQKIQQEGGDIVPQENALIPISP